MIYIPIYYAYLYNGLARCFHVTLHCSPPRLPPPLYDVDVKQLRAFDFDVTFLRKKTTPSSVNESTVFRFIPTNILLLLLLFRPFSSTRRPSIVVAHAIHFNIFVCWTKLISYWYVVPVYTGSFAKHAHSYHSICNGFFEI